MNRTLIIIYGEVRTLETTVISIYRNVILENHPCHVILSLDGRLSDIPQKTLTLLEPYLADIYFTNHKHEEDIPRDHNRIEFTLVKNALDRLTSNQKEMYTFMLKIRTDLFVKSPIRIKNIYGLQPFQEFKKDWNKVVISEETQSTKDLIKTWLLTAGGISFFLEKYRYSEKPATSPWSLSDTVEWNTKLWETLECEETDYSIFGIHRLIRKICYDARVMYLFGSTWIHFGYFPHVFEISMRIFKDYGTLIWNDHHDDDILEWVDHKGVKRSKPQGEWKWITDDQMRLVHNYANTSLIDMVNPYDYIESFDSWNSLPDNMANPNLFAFIVRPQSIRKK